MTRPNVELATYLLDGEPIEYRLVRSGRRVKTITLQVDETRGMTLSVPQDMTRRAIRDFLDSRVQWLRDCKQTLTATSKTRDWDNGQTIRYRGNDVQVVLDRGAELGPKDGVLVQRSMDGDMLRVSVPNGESGRELDIQISQALERWYVSEAREHLPARLAQWSNLTGLVPDRVRVGNARTRWGSCSLKRSINLSWRLIKLSDYLTDYVMVHELAHLQELNHQRPFWDLVESIMPDARERRKRLRSQRL